MAIRTQTASPSLKYTIENVGVFANGGITPYYMNRARTTMYGRSNGANGRPNKLWQSTDGGASWVLVKDLDSVSNFGDLVGMVELPSGEMLIALSSFGSFAATIYRSTGFATNPQTATWSSKTVLQASLIKGYSLHNLCIGSNGVILASEGGSQTDSVANQGLTKVSAGSGYTTASLSAAASGGSGESLDVNIQGGDIVRIGVLNGGSGHVDGTYSFVITGDGTGAAWNYTVTSGAIKGVQSGKARKLYISTDFGETWAEIFDIFTTPTTYKYGVGIHLHSVCYDEDWDRIWVCFGDDIGDGDNIAQSPAKSQIYYSDDRGATWTLFEPFAYFDVSASNIAQYTSVRAYKDSVVFLTDARFDFGVMIWPKIGFRQMASEGYFGPNYQVGAAQVLTAQTSPFDNRNNQYPVFNGGWFSPGTMAPFIIGTSDGGFTWIEMWRESDLTTRPPVSGGGITEVLGPDTSNRILATYSGYSSNLRGTLDSN